MLRMGDVVEAHYPGGRSEDYVRAVVIGHQPKRECPGFFPGGPLLRTLEDAAVGYRSYWWADGEAHYGPWVTMDVPAGSRFATTADLVREAA